MSLIKPAVMQSWSTATLIFLEKTGSVHSRSTQDKSKPCLKRPDWVPAVSRPWKLDFPPNSILLWTKLSLNNNNNIYLCSTCNIYLLQLKKKGKAANIHCFSHVRIWCFYSQCVVVQWYSLGLDCWLDIQRNVWPNVFLDIFCTKR